MKKTSKKRARDGRDVLPELLRPRPGGPSSIEEAEQRVFVGSCPFWLPGGGGAIARARTDGDKGTTHFTEPWLRFLRHVYVRDHARHLLFDPNQTNFYYPGYPFPPSSSQRAYKTLIIQEVQRSILDLRIFLSLCVHKTEEDALIKSPGRASSGPGVRGGEPLPYLKGNEGRKDRLGAVFDEKAFRRAFTAPEVKEGPFTWPIAQIVEDISRLGGEGLAVQLIRAAASPWGFEYRLTKSVESGI